MQDKDTVGALAPGMPMVAATPYLVTIAEMVCYEICNKLIEPGQITVGARVVIDHLGASKVGAHLSVDATLRSASEPLYLSMSPSKTATEPSRRSSTCVPPSRCRNWWPRWLTAKPATMGRL